MRRIDLATVGVVTLVSALLLPLGRAEVRAAAPSVRNARVQDSLSIYGYVRRVVLEPSADTPRRMQVWGTFSVAVTAPGVGYHAPEGGYLYFELPTDADTALKEWADLKRLGDTGGPWINAVAVRMLDQLPAVVTRPNYALVDRVVLEPNRTQPERIEIWGVFAIGKPDAYSYAPPERGYLFYTLPPDPRRAEKVLGQWNDWVGAAAKRQVVFFLTFDPPEWKTRVRPVDEKPVAPVPYDVGLYASLISPDTLYAPVRALLGFR